MLDHLHLRTPRVLGVLTAAALVATTQGATGPATAAPGLPARPTGPLVGTDHWAGSSLAHRPGAVRTTPAATASASLAGFDVSHWQGGIDWARARSRGAYFAYMKATEGTSYIDPMYAANAAGSRAAGLLQGAYHFARPDGAPAITQADYFLAHGGGWSADGKTLPPELDIESVVGLDTCYSMTPAAMVAWISAFSDEIRSRTTRYPAIYTNSGWWQRCTADSGAFSATNPLSIAHWSSPQAGPLPGTWASETFWQWADSGVFPGDQELYPGSPTQLSALAFGKSAADADHDGVIDALDSCPTLVGLPGRRGCPWLPSGSSTDLNGDGRADVLWMASGSSSKAFYAGAGAAATVNGSSVPAAQLLFADFNGDRRADVLWVSVTGQWRVSYGGTGAWVPINLSAAPIERLQVADLNGDGRADVFWAGPDGGWRVSYGGTSTWTLLTKSGAPAERLQLADINGDRRADVIWLGATGAWLVSYGGTKPWVQLTRSGAPAERLQLADLNGDGRADMFWLGASGAWLVSYSASGPWTLLTRSGATADRLQLADLNGDHRADAVWLTVGGTWLMSSGAKSPWVTINRQSIPSVQLMMR